LYKDLLDSLGYDMRLSTAAHNSARFPFASPPGSWQPQYQPAEGDDKVELQRLQDGGLFENYGAETALEILSIARRKIGERFNPIVILITSDPGLAEDIAAFPYNPPLNFAYELLSTFRSYAQTRLGRGAEAATRLKVWAQSYPLRIGMENRFAYFRMCPKAKDQKMAPPLGWALSKFAQREIKAYLSTNGDCSQANLDEFKRVVKQLDESWKKP
jgi:hypothetical protein